MDGIPAEIRENILKNMRGQYGCDPIAQYASISREWQSTVERHTFRSLKVSSDDFDEFENLFTGRNIWRRGVISRLEITFLLPLLPNTDGCCEVERVPDREADSVSLSANVARLFSVLSGLEQRAGNNIKPLGMQLWAMRRWAKSKWGTGTDRVPCHREPGRHSRREVEEAKARFDTFELRGADKLKSLNHVTDVNLGVRSELGNLRPGWIQEVVNKLAGLETLKVDTEDRYEWGRDRRIFWREGMTKVIHSLHGDQLKHLGLLVSTSTIYNENVSPHMLLVEGKEFWSSLVEHISTTFIHLVRLQLKGGISISPQFFQNMREGSFLLLEELSLEFAPETADGRWFYQRDEEAYDRSRYDERQAGYWKEIDDGMNDSDGSFDSTDEDYYDYDVAPWKGFHVYEDGPLKTDIVDCDQFRTKPDETTLLPFLMDSAKAVERMPRLKKFILSLSDGNMHGASWGYPGETRIFQLWYLKAGTPRSSKGAPDWGSPEVHSDAKYLGRNRLYWRVDQWTPWEEVQEAWGEVVGPGAKIVWLDEEHWKAENGWNRYIYDGDF